jgi:hypothetical protein
MYIDDVRPGDLASATGAAVVGDMEVEAEPLPVEEDPPQPPLAPDHEERFGQTGHVRLFNYGCQTGASASFELPIQAFFWNACLGYADRSGRMIPPRFSPHATWPASYSPGTTLTGIWRGVLPRGTYELRAWWWYGAEGDSVPGLWWNRVYVNC